MQKKTKITLVVIAVILCGTIYSSISKNTKPTTSESDIQPTEQAPVISDSNTETLNSSTDQQPSSTLAPTVTQTNTKASQSSNTLTYKGQFFPFQFTYPNDFRTVKNPKPSTEDLETGSYNFNYLAINGGIAGFVSFYVSPDDSAQYEELVTTYPEIYSKVTINNNLFYRRLEKISNSNSGYRVEYTTFKNGVGYRFSLVVTNGDKKDLDVTAYQTPFSMFDNVVRSLKIN